MQTRAIAGLVAALSAVASRTARSQTGPDWIKEARAIEARDPRRALALFERALARDSLGYEPNWRAAVAAADLAETLPPATGLPARDSLFQKAERYARRAVAADSSQADGLFALALALGRAALTKGKRERVRYGDEVYALSNRVLAINPNHDGAHHVLGAWNAEIMRLSGLSRFLAKWLLGAKLLDRANWADAIAHLERAVALDSNRVFHRLDLARVYAERKRYTSARREIDAIERLPNGYSGDERYRLEAAELRQRIAGKTNRDEGGSEPGLGLL